MLVACLVAVGPGYQSQEGRAVPMLVKVVLLPDSKEPTAGAEMERAKEKARDEQVKKTSQSALKLIVDILSIALQRDLRLLHHLGEAALFVWFEFKQLIKAGVSRVGL
jgi:hypothetical protein